MSDGVVNSNEALRALALALEEQVEHPVWAPVRVAWEQSEGMDRLCVSLGGTVQWMSAREVLELVVQRGERIRLSQSDPLRHCWEHEMWRRIDLAIARKRLEHPGRVLELLVTGGLRPGKTEGLTRRTVANFLYTPEAWTWALHQTDDTSRTIQQKRVEKFLPVELKPESGKLKKDKVTKFTYTAGTGFTGAMFHLKWRCQDEEGRQFTGGGEFDFRFYKQDEATFQGSELTGATSDELIPLPIAKTVVERMATRAADTARPEFLARIRRAVEMLERGESLPAALLGAVYHSVHGISFTPKEGWSATVSHFLNGATKHGWEVSPDLVDKPGVKDPRVPRFAQPPDPLKLVAYLFTSDNRIKPAYPALRETYRNASESAVRLALHGDVDKDWKCQFHAYNPERHLKDWKDVPAEGTVYEVIDPAGVKPWVIKHYLCDVAGRHWLLQEWPCDVMPIEGRKAGAWAVVSESEKRNGDKGPAQLLRLEWTRAHYVRLIWQMRARLAQKLREMHGDNLKVRTDRKTLEWPERKDWKLEGEFVLPYDSMMDSRYAQVRTEVKGITRTLLEAMMDEDNGFLMSPAPGDSLHEGDQFIQQALSDDVLGLPGFMMLRECTNTQFTYATYCLPEHRENTKADDEACKDFRDPDAYYLLSDPKHKAPRKEGVGAWSGGVRVLE